jgi:hypothetical protein
MHLVTKPRQGVLPETSWRERLDAAIKFDVLSGSLDFAQETNDRNASSLRCARDDSVLRPLSPKKFSSALRIFKLRVVREPAGF